MAKLAVLTTIFAVLLLVANAYAYRTTITTVQIDEEGRRDPRSQKDCRQEIQESDLSQCERFITQSREQRIAMIVGDAGRQQKSQSLQLCCDQMREMVDECQCEALKEIVEEGQQKGRQILRDQGQQQQQMMERAQTVVTYCRLPQRCEWQSAW